MVVPTYNERAQISEVIDRLFAAAGPDVDLMVVDDASPDRTADAVRAHSARERITLIERPAKLGLGSAYLNAFERALSSGYARVVEMDADLSHDPGDVPRLIAALDHADVVIGSRYVTGGRIENWSALRRVLSRAGNFYARTWFGWPIGDATSGFRAFRADFLRSADLDTVRSEGYAFQVEMVYRALRTDRRVVEIPVIFVERGRGTSKLSRRIVLEALWRVPGWGIRYRLRSFRRTD